MTDKMDNRPFGLKTDKTDHGPHQVIVAPPSSQHIHDGLLFALDVDDHLEDNTAEVVHVVHEPRRKHRAPLDPQRLHVTHESLHFT